MSRSLVSFFLKVGQCVIPTEARINTRLATVIRKEGLVTDGFSECGYNL